MTHSNWIGLIDKTYKKRRSKCIKKIAAILNTLCTENDTNELLLDSPFFKNETINISLFDYLIRLEKYFNCSNTIIIAMLIYIDRIYDTYNIYINKYSAHRIVVAAYSIANKYIEDDQYSNKYYAKIAGITLCEFNLLEEEILKKLNYELHIDESLYENYAKNFMM